MGLLEPAKYNDAIFNPAEVHSGDVYKYRDAIVLNSNQVQQYFFSTPVDNIWPHLHYKITTTGKIEIDLFEAPDYVGDKAVTVDKVDIKSLASKCAILKGIKSGLTKSTSVSAFKYAALTEYTKPDGAITEYPQEQMLKNNTRYVLSVKSLSENNSVTADLQWYEHAVIGVK